MPLAPLQVVKDRKYPYYGYQHCMKVGDVVKEHGGEKAGVPKSVIAQGLGMSQAAASFAQIIASAKTWGIVEGFSELRLTQLGREFYYPTTAIETRMAELAFLVQPTAYAFLIKEFDGSRIPSTTIMANKLGKSCGVPESWKMRAAQLFVNAAEELGVLDQSGVLRYAATKHTAGANQTTARPRQTSEEMIAVVDDDFELQKKRAGAILQPVADPNNSVWFYKEGNKTIRIETPSELTLSLWLRLKKYIELIEPTEQPTEGPQSGGTERAP